MQLTIAMMASLAASASAAAHARRDYGYGGYAEEPHVDAYPSVYPSVHPVSNSSSSVMPHETGYPTGSSSSSTMPLETGYPSEPSTMEPYPDATGSSSTMEPYPDTTMQPYPDTTGSSSSMEPYPEMTVSKSMTSGAPKMTTSTVYDTKTYTVTDCPGYKSCGPEAVKTVTSVVAVSTTVCPVTDAYPEETESAHVSTSKEVVTKDSTLTYTLGSGASATVITTTIKKTSTKIIYATKTDSKDSEIYPMATDKPSEYDDQLTTTRKSTSTTTSLVTVYEEPTATPYGSPVGGDKGEEVESSDNPSYGGDKGEDVDGSPVGGDKGEDVDGSPIGGDKGEEGVCKPTTVTVTAKHTVTVTAGYEPTGDSHGVVPKQSSSAYYPGAEPTTSAGSTGFITKVKPTGTGYDYGYGEMSSSSSSEPKSTSTDYGYGYDQSSSSTSSVVEPTSTDYGYGYGESSSSSSAVISYSTSTIYVSEPAAYPTAGAEEPKEESSYGSYYRW